MPGRMHFFTPEGREVTEAEHYLTGGVQYDEDEARRRGLLKPSVEQVSTPKMMPPAQDKMVRRGATKKAG
jgi:hypothetical protein